MNDELARIEAVRQVRIAWEALWAKYVEKLQRLDDLRAQGRYGYQLRMPKKSLGMAVRALTDFEKANGMKVTL